LWFGSAIFEITSSTFENLVAGDLSSQTDQRSYGGGIYSESSLPGSRLLTNITFLNNAVMGSKGVIFILRTVFKRNFFF
jgi:hypothetical protein